MTARHSDPDTSHAAAATAAPLRRTVLEAFARWGTMTDEVLYAAVVKVRPASPSGVRTRRRELVDRGYVDHVGYGRTRAGRRSRTWGITAAGYEHLRGATR